MSSTTVPTGTDTRWRALLVLCAGMLMMVLDATVVNVALPAIQSDLGFSQSGLAWVVNGYLVSFGGLLLIAGRLGDLLGSRRVFLAGLLVFTVSSIACGLAQDQTALVAARFVQGVGGAMTTAVTLGMIVTMFPEPREQAKAMGVFGFVASSGGSVGLLAGGVLTQALSWHWIFIVNAPIGVVVYALTRRWVPATEGIGWRRGADVLGAVLVTSALMLGVWTIVSPAAELGWGAARTQVAGLASLALLAAFVVRQATAAQPLMPLRVLRNRNVAGANVIQALTVAGMFGMFFLGVLYLQQVLGYDALETGLANLPCTVVMAVMSVRYADRFVNRYGAQRVVVAGLVLATAGLGLYARIPVDGSFVVDVLPATILIGAGMGVSVPGLMMLAMSGVRPEEAGLASGLINTTCQVGAALGLAVLATVSSGRTADLLARGLDEATAAVGGFHAGFRLATALVAAAVLVAVVVVRQPRAAAEVEADAVPLPQAV
jgi:EmrB/QacA subfamily drug resistance transporter